MEVQPVGLACSDASRSPSLRNASLLLVLLAGPPFDRRPLRDPLDPLQQVGERLHVLLAEAGEPVPLDPRPRADVRDRVFAFAVAGQVLARLAGVLAAQLDLEDAVDSEGFVAETVDGVWVATVVSVLCFSPRNRRVRVGRIKDRLYAQGIFSLANFAKWFTWP